jgi:hypothetical protein
MPADEIAHGCCHWLDKKRCRREIPAGRSERQQRVREADNGEVALVPGAAVATQ